MSALLEGEPTLTAEAAIDQITVAQRQHHRKRERALSAREALLVLNFESIFVLVASAQMRDGRPLDDDDHARLVVAVGRIGAIVDEVVG